MNCLKKINWVIYVMFYNLRLIAEDLLLEPILREISRLKSLHIAQKDRYEPRQLTKVTNFNLKVLQNSSN